MISYKTIKEVDASIGLAEKLTKQNVSELLNIDVKDVVDGAVADGYTPEQAVFILSGLAYGLELGERRCEDGSDA